MHPEIQTFAHAKTPNRTALRRAARKRHSAARNVAAFGTVALAAVASLLSVTSPASAQTPTPAPVAPSPVSVPLPDVAPARSLFDGKRAEDLLHGRPGSVGYSLSHGGVLPMSVVVTRNGVLQKAGTDYTLDARGGILTLTRAASADETLLVRYRYVPGAVGLSGGGAQNAAASLSRGGITNGIVPASGIAPSSAALNIAPSFAAGLPALNIGKLGMGFVRVDNGDSTNALLRLQTPNGGLAFLSNSGAAGMSQQASSLLGGAKSSEGASIDKKDVSANQFLIAQSQTIGGKGAQVSLNYQSVSRDFQNFASLRQMQAAPEADIAQLEKERGLKRMGYGFALGGKPTGNLQFSQSTLSGGNRLADGGGADKSGETKSGGDIMRQSASLAAGGLSLSMNSLSVDKNFARWKDLAAGDLPTGTTREQFQKSMGGVTRRDLAGKWQMGSALSFEGGLLESQRQQGEGDKETRDSAKDTRFALQFAPKNGLTLSVLDETTRKTTGALLNGDEDSKTGKTEQKATRAYAFATNPKKSSALAFNMRTVRATDAAGKSRNEAQQKAELKTTVRPPRRTLLLPGLVLPHLTLRGARETVGVDEIGKDDKDQKRRRVDTIASLFGIKSEGDGSLRLNYEERRKTIRPTTTGGDAAKSDDTTEQQSRLIETTWSLNKSTIFTYMSLTDDTGSGETATNNIDKENIALSFGRGWKYAQTLEKTVRTDDEGEMTEQRADGVSFATDPAAPIFLAGERRETQNNNSGDTKDTEEIYQTWRSGLRFGPLSLKVDGLGIRRENMAESLLKREKNIVAQGSLTLFAGLVAKYDSYDRIGKDPQSKLMRDERMREWGIGPASDKSPLRLGFVSRTYENRHTNQAERVREETSFAPLKPFSVGFLKNSSFTLAYGTDEIRESDREGVTRKLSYATQVGGHKFGLEWANGRDANGLPALSKAFSLATRAGGRFLFATRQGLREARKDESTRDSQWSRSYDASYRLSKYQTITYSKALRPEKPDTTWEPRNAEQMGYALHFGRGGKFVAEYKFADDLEKKAGSRTTLFSLVSPASPTTSYEFTYLKEETVQGEKRSEMNTYILAYQYLPTSSSLSVVLGARWHDFGGDIAAPFDIKEQASATIEIKGAW